MKKLAIVGTHPDTRDNAPWGDSSFDIWVFNEAAQAEWCKRWDACFQLHAPEIYRSPHNRSRADHWEWLQQRHGKPIYMQDVDLLVPDSIAYPLEAAIELTGEKWFTSSLAYSVALAILQGYNYIELYGADLTSHTEYAYQAECLRAWVYFAKGRGVEVVFKCWPDVFIFQLYGYEGAVGIEKQYFDELGDKTRESWKSAEKNLQNLKKALKRYADAREWEKLKDAIERYRAAAALAGELSGKLAECERYSQIAAGRIIDRQEYEYNSAMGAKESGKLTENVFRTYGATEYIWNVTRQTGHLAAVNQLMSFVLELGRLAYDAGAWVGKRDLNYACMGLFDKLLTAAGGQKSYDVVTHDNH